MESLSSIFGAAWRPPDRREPWQWCEEHIASIAYSPMPGRFRSENSPWVREVMERVLMEIYEVLHRGGSTTP